MFDPNADPFLDLQKAASRAKMIKKNILVEVGADWCVWCHRLESFIVSHLELYLLRSQNFVHVRIHSGEGDKLPDVFQKLPPFDGIPHYFVYAPDGSLLHSQDTELLEDGESYNYDKVWEFLTLWGVDPSGRKM
jgi:thiol:disulfide interchange protein